MGGCIGLFFASFMQLITISTANYQTLSELAFQFTPVTRHCRCLHLLLPSSWALQGACCRP
jgi:hypothetical protein